jgi:N-acetylglutamate synthase-like GNAT family acetyltransferase
VEYLIRQARITDVDRLYALCAQQGAVPGGDSPIDAIGLLRQLVYIPNASVAIAEAGRQMVGGAILGLRPSVRNGGFVGTIDLLVVADGTETDKVADLLIEEMLHSARRKGCATVEVVLESDSPYMSSWQGHGFARAAVNLHRAVIALRAQTGR